MTNGLLIYGSIFAHFLIYKEALPQCNSEITLLGISDVLKLLNSYEKSL
jgi:hypothetical protein